MSHNYKNLFWWYYQGYCSHGAGKQKCNRHVQPVVRRDAKKAWYGTR